MGFFFLEELLLSGSSTMKAKVMDCCINAYPFAMFLHLRKVTEELIQNDDLLCGKSALSKEKKSANVMALFSLHRSAFKPQ